MKNGEQTRQEKQPDFAHKCKPSEAMQSDTLRALQVGSFKTSENVESQRS